MQMAGFPPTTLGSFLRNNEICDPSLDEQNP